MIKTIKNKLHKNYKVITNNNKLQEKLKHSVKKMIEV